LVALYAGRNIVFIYNTGNPVSLVALAPNLALSRRQINKNDLKANDEKLYKVILPILLS